MNINDGISEQNASHKHHHHGNLKGRKLATAVIMNLIITGSQIFGGVISGSLALLTDALHNFSDVLALLISWSANKLSGKSATEERTFGYKRAEILAAMINSSALLVIAVFLIVEAVKRFFNPVEVKSLWVIILAGLSIILNGLSVLLLSTEAKGNMNMKSAYLHMLTDMMTSVAVLAGGIAIKFLPGITWIDPVLSIGIALYLVFSSFSLLVETLKVLMQFTPEGISIQEIEENILRYVEIRNLHHVHVWQLNDDQKHFEGHIGFAEDIPLSKVQSVLEDVRRKLGEKFGINHVTIQPELEDCDDVDLISGMKEG